MTNINVRTPKSLKNELLLGVQSIENSGEIVCSDKHSFPRSKCFFHHVFSSFRFQSFVRFLYGRT